MLLLRSRHPWNELLYVIPLTADAVLEATLPAEQEDLAQHFNTMCPGTMERLARIYVGEVATKILVPEIVTQEEWDTLLQDPCTHLGMSDGIGVRAGIVTHFQDRIGRASPNHHKWAMIAKIELGLGNFVRASISAGFADCLERSPAFDELMLQDNRTSPKLKELLLASERRKAEIMADLIKAYRLTR